MDTNSFKQFKNASGSFKAIRSKVNPMGGTRKEKPWVRLQRSGYFRSNLWGWELALTLSQVTGIDIDQAAFEFSVSEDETTVAAYLVGAGSPVGARVRNYPEHRYFASHMGGVFFEYPHLVPPGKRQCTVNLAKDENGRPCMLISLASAVHVPGRRNKGEKQDEESETQTQAPMAQSAPEAKQQPPASTGPAAAENADNAEDE